MRNFNSISNFLGANALQFIGGGNSQNEVRKAEGEQPRNRQRISNLSLTLDSTFVRYAVCIALLLCLGVGQMWGANGDTLFVQNFNSATAVAFAANTAHTYTSSNYSSLCGTTTTSQFTTITDVAKKDCGLGINSSTGGNSENWSGKFGVYANNTSYYWSICKTSNFAATAPTAIKIEMNAAFSYVSSGSNTGVQIAVGSSFSSGLTNSCPALTNCVAGFSLPSNSSIKISKYVTSNGVTNLSSSTLTNGTSYKYTWIINNTASSLSYTDPKGNTSSVASGCWDLWIGNTLYCDDVTKATTGMSGTSLNNLYIGSSFGKKHEFVIDDIKVTDLTPAAACTAPNHVDITPTTEDGNYGWRYSLGDTLKLTATAYSSEGTGSPITSGITGYQWQKYVGSTWTDLTDGTTDGVTISGATTANLQISNLKSSNGGSYRCTISTGTTCSTSSGGYWVRVFTLNGNYSGSSFTENAITWTDEYTGTATVHLNAGQTYEFKIYDNDLRTFGNGGTITTDVTGWDFGTGSGNCSLKTYYEGDYTFTISNLGHASDVSAYVTVAVTYPMRTLYLQLCSDWKAATAKYAIYYWRSSKNGWSDFMDTYTCDGDIRYTDIPSWAETVIFARFNPSKSSTGNWDDKYNQTTNQTLAANKDYLYSVSGSSDSYSGSWGTFSPTTYTISYDAGTNGSGSKSDETKTCGEDFTLPSSAVFTRSGYTQTGWTTSDGGSQTHELGGSYTTNDDQTFYPVWTGNTYTITYKEEDKTTVIDDLSPSSYTCGVGATLPTPAARSCYTFDGWYKSTCVDKDGFVGGCKRTAIDDDSYGNYTFYGKWTLNSHTLAWNFNGGTTEDPYTAAGTVNCGADLTIPTLTKTGYTFSAWSSTPSVMPDNDLTLTASWTANNYTVTLDPDNGNSPFTVTATYDASMPGKLSDGETDVAAPTYTGYTFGGYYDDHAGAGKQYYTSTPSSANTWDKASATTLYAKWTQTVTLKTGSQGSGSDLTPTVLYKGTALSGFSSGHTAKGYKLLGYYTAASEGTKVLNADGTFAASSVTDYITGGQWTKANATTLFAQWEDMEITLPGTLDKANNIETGGGLTFDEDYLDYSKGDNNHRDGYAEWKVNIAQKCIYTVTIDGNYTSTGRQWEMYLVNGSGTTISTCTFDAKYDTGDQSYTKNWDLSGIAATGTYIVRLKNTLEWGAGKVLNVTIDPIKVTYDANGGTCATTSAYYTGSALTLPTPTRSGYVFEGWYNDSGTKIGNAGASYEPTASITLTAKWAPIVSLPGTLNKANMETYGEDLTFKNDTLDYGTGTNHHRDGYADWKVNVEKVVYKVTTDGYYSNGHQWKVYLISGSDTLSTCVFDNNNSTGSYTETKQWDLSGITSAGVYTIRMRNIREWGEPTLKSVTISPITVTYDANGGSCATESAVYGGSALTLPTPTRSGYTFDGWYSAGTKIGNAGASFTPTKDTTLYAHWTDNISGKLFSYIDGHYGDVRKSFDGTIISGNATEKDKTFTDGSTGVQFVIDDGAWDNKTNNIALLAKLVKGTTGMSVVIPTGKIAAVKIGYGAYYNTKGEKNYGPLTIGGSNQTGISTPLDDGMTNAQVDGALKEIELTSQTGTLTLGSASGNIFIGRVSAVITGYVITYATGDYGSGDSFTATKTAGSSYTISSTDNAFTRTNCVYDGWSVNADGSTKDYDFGDTYTTDAALTLYPHWVATCATPDAPTGFSASSITDEGVTFTITDAGDAGNYDIYYSTSSTAPTGSTDATTTATAKTAEVTGLSEGTTYYAWVRAVCDETHKSNWVALNPEGDSHTLLTHYTITTGAVTTLKHGDAAVGGSISAASHAAAGDEVTLTATPESGYAFVSWTIEKTSDNSDITSDVLDGNTLTMPAYGVTVKATFAEQFTIVYIDDDKTTVLDGLEPTYYLYGTGVAALPTPTKTGYTFDSWYNAWCVESKNKGSWEDECRKSSIGTTDYSNATYYASWTAIDYTITHSDAENGTYTIQVDDASATDATTTANIGQTITLTATPSSGYALSAWNVTSGGDPIDVVDGEFTMPAADVTIAPTFGVVYTVTFNTNGGSSVGAIEQDAPGAAIAMPDAPTKSGYDFVNWMIGGETFDPADSYTPTANITAYATWKAECAGDDPVLAIGATEETTSSFLQEYSTEGITVSSDKDWKGNDDKYGGLVALEASSSGYDNTYLEVLASSYNISKVSFLLTGNGSNKDLQPVVFGWASTASSTADTYRMLEAQTVSNKGYANAEWFTYDFSASEVKRVRIYRASKNVSSTSPSYTGSSTAIGNATTIWIYGIKVWLDDGSGCYYVTYDGNGATGGYVNDAAAHENNDFVIVSSNAGGYTRTGNYEFNGWNTKADGTGTDFDYYSYPNDHFTITQDTTLYAQWRIVIDENTSNLTAYEDPAHKDVRVTNGAKLTLTQDTTVRNMLVETGSTLNVAKNGEEGIKLTAKRLSLQGGWGTVGGETKYDMPRVYIDPASKIKKRDTIINFDLAVNNACYYPFVLPFDVPLKISAGKDYSEDSCMVDYTHHTLAYYSNYGANGQFAIKTYDGQSRANNGGSSANWKHVAAGATLKAGHGYALTAIALGGIYGEYAVIRFPMKVDNAWLTAGEIGHYTDAKSVEHIKDTVHVTAYKKEGTGEGTGDQTPKANIGWNLLGVPYMACYTTSGDMYNGSNVEDPATLIQGRFNYSTNKWEDGEIMYVTVPVHDFSEYVQADITDSDTKLLPGWCFFVQVAETGNLCFLSASETESSSLPIYAPKREKADMPTVKTGIILSGAETSDKTTILVSDRYSAAEYEINADLEKMFGENSYTLATYSLSGETRLAYNAMSNADAANIIPIGYRVPAEGSYTFDINPHYAQNEAFEHVNLIDYETGFVTDLLQASYTFSSDRTQNDSRFALNVVKIKETPTGIENGANDAKGVRKLLLNDKLYIILDNKMYDATGRMVK